MPCLQIRKFIVDVTSPRLFYIFSALLILASFSVESNKRIQNFLGASVVKNLPVSVGDNGFNGLSRKMAHAAEQLSPHVHHKCWTCALEPRSRNHYAHVLQLVKPSYHGACALQQWDAHAPQLEKSLCSTEDPAQPKIS